MMELIFKVMKAFSLYYVSWKIVPFGNYSNKRRIFVTIESCAFNIQFEGVIRSCRPNFWQFKEILIAWYYIHRARSKSETPRLNVFITFFWKLKFNVKEKLLLKPQTKSNTEISGPPCAFLICIVTSRVNDFKYVLFLVLFCFSALLIVCAKCINCTVSLVFFFPYLSYMANLFYYSMCLVNQCFHAKEGFYYSIVQVIKVILNFQWFWYKSHVCIWFIHVDFMQIDSFTVNSWRFTCFL